jgi:hypothetical protein
MGRKDTPAKRKRAAELQRARRARYKEDPERVERSKVYERLKWEQRKKVNLTEEEKKKQQKTWREKKQKLRYKNKVSFIKVFCFINEPTSHK